MCVWCWCGYGNWWDEMDERGGEEMDKGRWIRGEEIGGMRWRRGEEMRIGREAGWGVGRILGEE